MKSSTRFSKRSVNHVTTLGLGLLVLGMIAAGPALAATDTASLGVSATVASTCDISTTPVAFGTYDSIANASVALDSQGAVIVTCTLGAPITVALGQGLFPFSAAPTAPTRQMSAGGAPRLAYFLYSNEARTTPWGEAAAVVTPPTGGTGAALSLPVYGRIPGGQNVPIGTYVDTVVATVTFP